MPEMGHSASVAGAKAVATIAQVRSDGDHERMANTKAIGAVTGLKFALACIERGASVSEPLGDYCPYDFILEIATRSKEGEKEIVTSRFLKVQVKSASKKKGADGTYTVNATRKVPKPKKGGGSTSESIPYSKGEVDALVSWADNKWFIFENVHELPGIVEIQPAKAKDACKWNEALERWERLHLAEAATAVEPEEVEAEAEVAASTEQQNK